MFDTVHPHLKPHSINFNLTPYENIPTMSFCFVPEIETYILEQTPPCRGPRTPLCVENRTVQRSFPRASCQPRMSWVLELLSVGRCWALAERTDQLPQSPSCSRCPTPATCLTVACFLVIS
ncbi:unnamed protein product [Rangifer tarandus platyrhynchus]|uniref:Uncharacterized protein n=1 Tax=Rangifer tarandus platyrhynchus TaxID=3082113 RepID=A0AC59YFK9_RANTA